MTSLEAYEQNIAEKAYAGEATPAEGWVHEAVQFIDQGRIDAAAEFYARILHTIPEDDRTPAVTNALRDGIEITLALKPLPPEQGEL